MGSAAGSFACDTCGKQYRWKPELAGKRAKCKCGAVVDCPASDPAAGEEDILDLAPIPLPPKAAPRATVAPVMAGLDGKERGMVRDAASGGGSTKSATRAKTLEYGTQPSAVTTLFPNPLMDLWAPLWVFAIATVIEIILLPRVFQSPTRVLPFAMGFLFAYVAVKTILLALGMLMAVKMRQIAIGSIPAAALKLLAIAVAPSAAMDLVGLVTRFLPFLGFVINLVCGFIVYFALIGTFFELDQEDTWYCVKVVFVTNILVILGLIFWVGHLVG